MIASTAATPNFVAPQVDESGTGESVEPAPETAAPEPDAVPETSDDQKAELPPADPPDSTPELKLPEQDFRTWTAANSSSSVIAKLVNFNETHVQLERQDTGKRVSLPIEKLSDEDQRYVQIATTPRYDQDAEVLVGRITRIVDGDTVILSIRGVGEAKIRLEGVDAPETGQRFGDESKSWLSSQILGKDVRAELTGSDRYGRKLGHLYVDSTNWVNQGLILAGLAWHYAKYNHDTRLASAQQTARGGALGLWADSQRIAPWDYRNGQRVETALPVNLPSTRATDPTVYVTDTGTKYHRSGCRHIKQSHYPMPLSRAQSGYEPCKVCHP
ncbi:thermonuclease family protein [Rhodopirellula sp. MGV]|uniref:thermonuclease family protein n=1 Tax=Rhodopirellula sp. MGV TaxID=2023130 RepID=UPI001303F498|nr:thermonuclease family protein [Rhodopirellula sp. MGV]